MFTLFLTAMASGGVDFGWLGGLPGLSRGLVFTPASAHDPYLDDGPPPALVLQLYFADIADLEASCGPTGTLQALVGLLEGVTQQAMVARSSPVPDPTPASEPACTYLVAYTGAAEDLNLWHAHYIASHAPLMQRFPGIRGIEICTRMDWVSFLPFARVDYMQRNKNVFDSAEALNAAINSPVRHDMRADFHKFPAFTGPVLHYPMLTRTIEPHRSPR
jgi:uncharacterized protein (TIGR02118 family)